MFGRKSGCVLAQLAATILLQVARDGPLVGTPFTRLAATKRTTSLAEGRARPAHEWHGNSLLTRPEVPEDQPRDTNGAPGAAIGAALGAPSGPPLTATTGLATSPHLVLAASPIHALNTEVYEP